MLSLAMELSLLNIGRTVPKSSVFRDDGDDSLVKRIRSQEEGVIVWQRAGSKRAFSSSS